MASGEICRTLHCENPARPTKPTCKTCGAAVCRWARKPIADIMKRQDTLEKWQDRIVGLAKDKLELKKPAVTKKYQKVLDRLPDIRIVKSSTTH